MVTQVNWVAQSAAELEVNDPEMAAFVVEFDKGKARVHIVPSNQGYLTQGVGGVSVQSQGIKKSFPCVWLPESVCVASRIHSLLSACPSFNRIHNTVPTVTFPPDPAVGPMVCSLTLVGLSLVNQRRKGVQAGSVCQLSPPLERPAGEFIHCSCSVCDQCRAVRTSRKTGIVYVPSGTCVGKVLVHRQFIEAR